jgi:membrane-associated phospholipid phosphatase
VSENVEQAAAAPGAAALPGTAPPAPGLAVPSVPADDAAAHWARRQRRPTGAPPPLPHPSTISTTAWLLLAATILAGAFVFSVLTPWLQLADHAGTWFLRLLADLRTPWLTDVARSVSAIGSGWGVTALALSVVALTMIFRRWRHLLVFIGSLLVLEIVGGHVYYALARPRPYGVRIIGGWGGYSAPSVVMFVFTFFLVGAVYCLVVPGRPRTQAKIAVAVLVALLGLARLYLAVDHPDDVLFGVVLAVAIPVAAFGYFTPNEVFPVVYRRGRTAHVDVTGRRGEAIRTAMRDQLGLTVLEIKPVGLASSAASMPLRLRVDGGPEEYVFAKLYTKSHVRADRWYKLTRSILYGSLEDEKPFESVRRLAEYEDHMLRLLRDSGIRTARPYGIVEITPEREYLLVTEFFARAVEIGDAVVDDGVIDQGLLLVRKLWHAGIAHRDIKPGNLMVRDGELLLIDVGFVQVRPSPWRQAIDLGNMMLVLAVRTDPDRVYQRALAYFTPDELGEAFAATRGVASPTQLRAFMKRDPRDLLGAFRALAPPREPIVLQRWSVQRIALACAVLGATVAAVVFAAPAFFPAGDIGANPPICGTGHSMILSAQAVPSAALVPCVAGLPSGWHTAHADIVSGRATFWLDSDQAGTHAVTVTLTATCDTSGAQQVRSDRPGTRRFERPLSQRPFEHLRFYTFPGGCVTYEFKFSGGASSLQAIPISGAVAFMPRARLVDHIRNTEGLALCGRGAPCPG